MKVLRGMRRLGAVVATAALLAGCGESVDSGFTADDEDSDFAAEVDRENYQACVELTEPLVDALRGLDSRLNTGLQFERYTNLVADARVEYDELVEAINADDGYEGLGGYDCVNNVALQLEGAMTLYGRAGTTWNDCIADTYCVVEDTALPKMQGIWERASKRVAKARSNLADLEPTAS